MSAFWTTSATDDSVEIKTPNWCVKLPVENTQSAFLAPQKKQVSPPEETKPEPLPEPLPPSPPKMDPKVKQHLELLSIAIDEAVSAKQSQHVHTAEVIVEMGLSVAEKLACGAIEADKTRVLDIVKEALGLMSGEEKITVKLNPEIVELLTEAKLLDDLQQNPAVSIKTDPSVGSIGCIIESSIKRIDAQISSRVFQLKHLFKQTEGGDK